LIAYPYGCVEQTMSSFFPNVIVSNLLKELGSKDEKTFKELPKMVDAGLRRLYDFQHSDGGWGWWKDDNTDPFMTAYVLLGFTEAKKAGVEISDSSYTRGMSNLKLMLEDEKIDITTKYYILYVLSLSGHGDPALTKKQFEMRLNNGKKITNYALSLLTLALRNQGFDKEAETALGELISRAKNSDHWEGGRSDFHWYEDPVESTSFALKALVKINPRHKMIPKIVKWLMKSKTYGDHWNSTRDTSIAIYGLVDYLNASKEIEGNYSVKLYGNGKLLRNIHLGKDDIFKEPVPISIDKREFAGGGMKIKAVKNGPGVLYMNAATGYYSNEENIKSANGGFGISKTYWLLKPRKGKDGWIFTGKKLGNNPEVKLGDQILVELDVSTENPREYIMIEDYLPSGFEVVRDTRGFDVRIPGVAFSEYKDSNSNWYSNMEIRDEKVAFFCSYFYWPKMTTSYIMRAEMTGTFHVMPAEAGLMYYPKVIGNSDEIIIKVSNGE
ncbi:MAG: hypothetical protein WCX65_13735, partial [bacterium]